MLYMRATWLLSNKILYHHINLNCNLMIIRALLWDEVRFMSVHKINLWSTQGRFSLNFFFTWNAVKEATFVSCSWYSNSLWCRLSYLRCDFMLHSTIFAMWIRNTRLEYDYFYASRSENVHLYRKSSIETNVLLYRINIKICKTISILIIFYQNRVLTDIRRDLCSKRYTKKVSYDFYVWTGSVMI